MTSEITPLSTLRFHAFGAICVPFVWILHLASLFGHCAPPTMNAEHQGHVSGEHPACMLPLVHSLSDTVLLQRVAPQAYSHGRGANVSSRVAYPPSRSELENALLQEMRILQIHAQAGYGQRGQRPPPPPAYQHQQMRAQGPAQDLDQLHFQQSSQIHGDHAALLAARQHVPDVPATGSYSMLQTPTARQLHVPIRRASPLGYQNAQRFPGVLLSMSPVPASLLFVHLPGGPVQECMWWGSCVTCVFVL